MNQTGVNHAVDKLISNLPLAKLTFVLPFSEGKMRKQVFLSAAVRSDARREAVPVCFNLDYGANVNTAR